MDVPGRITSEQQLRAIIGGDPTPLVVSKLSDRLNPLTRQFIERSPLVCVATGRPDGGLDISPRGDPAGFVRILDDRTLFIPERPGNRLADTLTNILRDARVGLLFLVPGITDSFRVNGTAALSDDSDLLGPCTVDGKVPKLGIVVRIEEAYTQCSKALMRSELWNPARHVDPAAMPTNGELLASVRCDPEFDAVQYDVERDARYARREGFY